jgi:hypothetical protein
MGDWVCPGGRGWRFELWVLLVGEAGIVPVSVGSGSVSRAEGSRRVRDVTAAAQAVTRESSAHHLANELGAGVSLDEVGASF